MIDTRFLDSADHFWNKILGRARNNPIDRPPSYPATLFLLSSVQRSSDTSNDCKHEQYFDKSRQQIEMRQIRL
jgi:hypothetical protein